jgi:hypothetical protein
MPAPPLGQLASSVAFPDQLCIGQLAEMRADRFHVDVLVAVFPGIMHQGMVARSVELFGEKRFVNSGAICLRREKRRPAS